MQQSPQRTRADLARLLSLWSPARREERIATQKANGRILAADLRSLHTIPVTRAAALDGIAVRISNFGGTAVRSKNFDSIADCSAWRSGKDFLRVDTGDEFDKAFDAIIPLEAVELKPGGGFTLLPEAAQHLQPGQNIRFPGACVATGELLALRHSRLGPKDLALLLAGGISRIPVLKKPRIALLPTGNELLPLGEALTHGKYIETNSLYLRERLKEMGARALRLPIVRDVERELEQALLEASRTADIMIITGGTSRGTKDATTRLLSRYRGGIYDDLPANHGKRLRLALINGTPVINLPGPPEAVYRLEWFVHSIIAHFLHQPAPEHQDVDSALRRLADFPVEQKPLAG